MDVRHTGSMRRRPDEAGYTLVEMLVSVFVLLLVSGLMMQGVLDMQTLGDQLTNRSDMHAGVRNATALLQQEVGQAGRVALPQPVTLAADVAAGLRDATVAPSAATMFVGQRLVVDIGDVQEVVEIVAIVSANQIRAQFDNAHLAGARIAPAGGFAEGVVPTTRANGSTASVLKIVGDINGDGGLVYVEYTCDWVAGRMYRNMMPFDAGAKPAVTVEQVILDNLEPNPPNPDGTLAPCFMYEERTINGVTYVVNVAIMTTVRTHRRDRVTGEFQRITKALLNVAPRNVFNVWQIASLGYEHRIQPLPASVVALLP